MVFETNPAETYQVPAAKEHNSAFKQRIPWRRTRGRRSGLSSTERRIVSLAACVRKIKHVEHVFSLRVAISGATKNQAPVVSWYGTVPNPHRAIVEILMDDCGYGMIIHKPTPPWLTPHIPRVFSSCQVQPDYGRTSGHCALQLPRKAPRPLQWVRSPSCLPWERGQLKRIYIRTTVPILISVDGRSLDLLLARRSHELSRGLPEKSSFNVPAV